MTVQPQLFRLQNLGTDHTENTVAVYFRCLATAADSYLTAAIEMKSKVFDMVLLRYIFF
jgi:hypothetical protein